MVSAGKWAASTNPSPATGGATRSKASSGALVTTQSTLSCCGLVSWIGRPPGRENTSPVLQAIASGPWTARPDPAIT
jgi:hypothetical protein